MQSFDMNSWGDFLSTPANMSGTPPEMPPESLIINEQAYESPKFTEEIQSFINAPSMSPCSPIFTKNVNQPQSLPQNKQNYQKQNFSDPAEIKNRTLLISGAPPTTTESDVFNFFNSKEDIKKIDFSKLSEGCFTVEFFDIRQAIHAKMLHNGSIFKENKISITFAPLPVISDPKNPPNNGTIVIFNLPTGITDDQIQTIFGQFGEIKQIRGTPTKLQQKFVEFYDTRAAENALMSLSGRYVMGCRVSIEFSLPGGFRRGIQKVENSNHQVSPLNQRNQNYNFK